jgi:acetylglutamate kinase
MAAGGQSGAGRAARGTAIVGPPGRSPATGVVVVKLGGRSLEAPGALRELAGDLAGIAGEAVLVHGGGPEVSAWCARLGIETRFDDGLRVTDGPTLEVAAAVLAGLANKRLVAALRTAGIDALGVAALDGGIVEARPHAAAARLGRVGEVAGVNAGRLAAWLGAGLVPVVASVGAHGGMLLNLNADDVAAAIAAGLGARALVLLSDAPGVRLGGGVAPALGLAAVDGALAGGEVAGGMRPKLRAARAAVAAGAGVAWIAAWQGPGTLAALLGGAPPEGASLPAEGAARG